MASKAKPKPATSLADLHGDPKNARKHNPRNIGQVQSSLQKYGAARSIVIDEDNQIIAGHGVVEAAALAGIERVQVVEADGETIIAVRRTGLTKKQKQALGIADNRAGDLSEWDTDRLAELMGDIDLGEFFTADELAELMPDAAGNDAEDPGAQVDKAAELQAKWGTALGQLWAIGRHRLLVGDCTVAENVARLMGGERAQLCFTDPPYGIGESYDEYEDTKANLIKLVEGWLPLARELADVVLFTPGNKNQWLYPAPTWVLGWFTGGGSGVNPWGFTSWHAVYAYGKDPYLAKGMGSRPDALAKIDTSDEQVGHPSQKPLSVWTWFLERGSTSEGDVVYEPFCGSGTTLVACEKLGRIGRGMELSPAYAAVTLERLHGLGLTPERVDA